MVPFVSVNVSGDTTDAALIKADLDVNTRYVYNIFYDFGRKINDVAFDLVPHLFAQSKPHLIYFKIDGKGLFEQFTQYQIQNHTDYDGNGEVLINEGHRLSFAVKGGYRGYSDPSPNETYGRLNHQVIDVSILSKMKILEDSNIEVKAGLQEEDFENPQIAAGSAGTMPAGVLANNTLSGLAQYNNNFLPETAWYVRASGGVTQFPNTAPDANGAKYKYNSTFAAGEAGIIGRLSESSTVDCAAGYAARIYEVADSFLGPVFYLRFTEQVTRRNQLMAGFDYTVKDTYWSNYRLDQEIYFGLGRIVGDQFLILTRISYDYSGYSLPNRRDDQRVKGAVSLRYSLTPAIKLTADLKVDLLSSDAYNTSAGVISQTNPDGTPVTFLDNPASYNAGSLGLGVMASF